MSTNIEQNDHNIGQKWNQSGPGGRGEGYPENQQNYEQIKKPQTEQTNFCFELWGDFFKNRRAQRLGVYRGIMKKGDKIDI